MCPRREEAIVCVKKTREFDLIEIHEIEECQPSSATEAIISPVNTLDERPQTATNDKANGPSFFVSSDFSNLSMKVCFTRRLHLNGRRID